MAAVLFGINRVVDVCFLADMFIQALLGYLDKKRNRWESRPRVTIKTYCKHWLLIDTLSLIPYDAIVILVPSHYKLKVMKLYCTLTPALDACCNALQGQVECVTERVAIALWLLCMSLRAIVQQCIDMPTAATAFAYHAPIPRGVSTALLKGPSMQPRLVMMQPLSTILCCALQHAMQTSGMQGRQL